MRGPVWGGEVTEHRVTGAFVSAPVVPPPPRVVLPRPGRVEVVDPATGEVRWGRDRRGLLAVAAADDLVYLVSSTDGWGKALEIEALREADARRLLRHEVAIFGKGATEGCWLEVTPTSLVLSVHRQGRLDVITLTPGEPPG